MAANEFEKNVQRIMDEFRLHPSGSVWQNVEKNIREQKRKRRILFLVIFSFIAIGLAGYGVRHFSSRDKIKTQGKNQNNDTNATTGKQARTTTSTETNVATHSDQNKLGAIRGKQSIGQNKSNLLITESKEVSNKRPHSASHLSPNNNNSRVAKKIRGNRQRQEDSPRPHVESGDSSNIASTEVKKDVAANDTARIESKDALHDNLASQKSTDSASQKTEQQKLTIVAAEKKAQSKQQNRMRWRWGLDLSGGLSTINRNMPFAKDQNKSYGNSVGTPGTTGPGFVATQSGNRSSFAFKAGVIANKTLSRRSSLSVGLAYSFLSDKLHTGTIQVSSAQLTYQLNAASYYSPGSQKNFTDRFHFIELPVSYDVRVTPNTKHFLSFDAGVAPGYLVATNALVYDTVAGGIYYHNKKLFSKAGLNLILGVPYHFTIKDMEIILGPQLSLGLNKVTRSDLDNRRYFLYGGINAALLFEKKKR